MSASERGKIPSQRWLLLLFPLLGALVCSALSAELSGADARERYEQLRTEIAHHDALYFQRAAPEISDADYDRLKREFGALGRAHPEWVMDAAGVGIGDDRSGRFPTRLHRERMLSLDKAYTEREWRAFHADIARRLGRGAPVFVFEPKYDGVAISLVFEKGRLARAITRGNGREGDDVTANVRTIRGLPDKLAPTGPDGTANPIPVFVELRGEIYVERTAFAQINAAQAAAGREPFATPRNLAAGTLKSLDPAEVATRPLTLVVYGWGAWEGAEKPATQSEFHAQVAAWGLPGVAWIRTAATADAGWNAIREFASLRSGLPFPVDGVVAKLDEVAPRESLGMGEQAPRWAIAYKYAPEHALTRVRAITIQVGRTGILTPVAELDPVDLDGTRIRRATLHNRAALARRDIRVGDFVEVEKAGEVIPAVVSVRLDRRPDGTKPFAFPPWCPSCGEAITLSEEVAVRCQNARCPEQRQRRLEHFASSAGVDIAGLGPATIARLVEEGLVAGPADLYRLRQEDLADLAGIGAVNAEKLVAAIERSRHAELWRFICGFGIPQVGPVNSRRLADVCGSLENLARSDPDRLAAIMGATAGRAAADFLARPENRAELEALTANGVAPGVRLPSAGSGRLRGKVVVFTGALPGLTREEAAARVREAGGSVRDSVTGLTNYLIVGDEPGQKLDEARRLGVPVIPAGDFLSLLAAD